MGLIVSIVQWIPLRELFIVTSLWIFTSIAGIIIGELIAGIVLWELGVDRADLGFAQGGSAFPEALILVFSGALIGLFQMPLLKMLSFPVMFRFILSRVRKGNLAKHSSPWMTWHSAANDLNLPRMEKCRFNRTRCGWMVLALF